MSVETGIAPNALLELDGEMWDAVVHELGQRWTPELELAAQLLEVEHAALVTFVRANSRKPPAMPTLTVPRPKRIADERQAPAAPVVSIAAFAGLTGRRPRAPEGVSGTGG